MKLAAGTMVLLGLTKGEVREMSVTAVASTLNEMTRAKG